MIAMNFRTFIIKALVFILSNLPSFKMEGRHPATDVSIRYILHTNYTLQVIYVIFANIIF